MLRSRPAGIGDLGRSAVEKNHAHHVGRRHATVGRLTQIHGHGETDPLAGRGGLMPRAEIIDRHEEVAEQPVVYGHLGIGRGRRKLPHFFRFQTAHFHVRKARRQLAGNCRDRGPTREPACRMKNFHTPDSPLSCAGSIRRYFTSGQTETSRARAGSRGSQGDKLDRGRSGDRQTRA